MSLTFEELESVTNDYFAADNGKAVDIYFNTSYLLNLGLFQKKGLMERPDGGEYISVPLEYDGQEGGFYGRGDTISSDDRESVNTARFAFKHSYGNATVRRIDELANSGVYAQVKLVAQRVAGAQKTAVKVLAGSIYDEPGGSSDRLTGLMACCHETSALAYGGIAEDDLVAADGTKPWEGKRETTGAAITLAIIRDMVTDAKLRDGAMGRPNNFVTTETLFNVIKDILLLQQRFTKSENTAKAGFVGVEFEGVDIFADDYCPSGTGIALNSNHWGFGVHTKGNFVRTKWQMIQGSANDRTMKIFWDGNQIVNNRKAHKARTGLTV